MSIQSPHLQESYPCTSCDGELTPSTSVKGSYCSRECWLRDKGSDVLSQIRSDHTRCSTCYRQLKKINRPPDRWLRDKALLIREALIGYEYPTPDLRRADGLCYCRCGTVGRRDVHKFIRERDPQTVGLNLLDCLHEYNDNEQIPDAPDARILGRTLAETELDVALAIGRAVYD